ncbi:MAG: HDOD domain-containing protein [Spirochaetes bacterium]|nr:HDOD domain-containing protein [Spirochaetota bacterium]
MEQELQRKSISKKIEKGEPITLSFSFINERVLVVINSILVRVLGKQDQIYLLNSVVTILRELVVNALKANAKRVFFLKHSLDIMNDGQYRTGMARFKKEIVGSFDAVEGDLKRSDFYVHIKFEFGKSAIRITVTNNSLMLPVELQRINLRMQKARQYNDFSEAYEEIEDDSEGAGLGIVLTLLLMKSMGIDPANYSIKSEGRTTVTTLTIPSRLKPVEVITKIKKRILREVEGIPTFPENIVQLQRLCNDPDSSFEDIVRRLKMDPALSTDVIKLSNSAGIAPYKRIEDIKSAVVTIGLKNLNAVLVASNARKILNERYSSFEMIWEHCNKVAFYARNIALSFRASAIVENVYMAGLLHDLGKIILLATDRKLVRKIADIVKDRKITATTMEEISIGISHSTIGSLISQKWNFPDYLTEAINYHHAPYCCSEKYRDIVYIIYLANMMAGIEDRRYAFYYIEETILERFNLLDETKFKSLHDRLKDKFDSTKSL